MDEPPPPGLEPEVYYAPAPQVAPAPIPTVYQPPPVSYIPPHPNPPIPEAPAVVEAPKDPSPEPPKPRAPKASVAVLQGGRKLALSSQKSNLASRLLARSSQQSQKSPHRLKQTSLRSDGQPHADGVFAASPPPQDEALDVSPAAGIPEPVPAYPAHLEHRSRSGSPRRYSPSVSPRRVASPPAGNRQRRFSVPKRASPATVPMTRPAKKTQLLAGSDDDSDIDDRLVPMTGKQLALQASPPQVFPTGKPKPRTAPREVHNSPTPSPPRVSAALLKPSRAAPAIHSVSRSPPRTQPSPPIPTEHPSDSRKRVARRQLSEDDDEDDIAAVTAQASPAGQGAAAKRRFRPRPSRSPPRHVSASPLPSRSPSPAPKHKRQRAAAARRSRSPAAPPAHRRSPPRDASPPHRGPPPASRYPKRSPPQYDARGPAPYPHHSYSKSPRGHAPGMDLRLREHGRPAHGPPPGQMRWPPPAAWGPPPHGPARHARPGDVSPRQMQQRHSHGRDLRHAPGHPHAPRTRTPSPHAPRPGPGRGSSGPRSYSPARHHKAPLARGPPRSNSLGRYSRSPPRRSPPPDHISRSRSRDVEDARATYSRSYATRSPDRTSNPPAHAASPRRGASPPRDAARRRSISRDRGDAEHGGRRSSRGNVSPPQRSASPHASPPRRDHSSGPAKPMSQSPHSLAKARGRGAVGLRSAGAWRRSSSARRSYSRSRSPHQRSPMPPAAPQPCSLPRQNESPARGPSPMPRASPQRPRDTPPRSAQHSRSPSPHMHEPAQRRKRGWDMSEGAAAHESERMSPPRVDPPQRSAQPAAPPPVAVWDAPAGAASFPRPGGGVAVPPTEQPGVAAAAPAAAPPPAAEASPLPAASPPAPTESAPVPAAAPKKPPAPVPHLHARRLQITGAPVSASAPELERLLNRAMRAAGLSTAPGLPVVSASVRPADRSAHIEFATPADAANAFALDGLMCRGMRLRFQRPPTFDLAKARQLGPVEPQRPKLNLERIAIVLDILNNFPTRALADRLPTDMPADSVRSALQAVPGVMAATVIDLDAAGAPIAVAASAAVDAAAAASARKPAARAAVVEISAVASLDAVLRSLNMLRVGGHPVTASRMATPVEVVTSQQALEDEHEAHLAATAGADGTGGSAGVRLKAMLSRASLEGQAAAVQHDIAAVARRYGDLLSVRLPEAPPASAATGGGGGGTDGTAPQGDGDADAAPADGAAAELDGDVLLSYRSLEAAERAAAALQGRVFAGRPIVAVVEAVH